VLFPIWISSYTYRGKLYRVLVNGETGKVAGDKPFSRAKVLAAAVTFTVMLGLIGFILLRTLSAVTIPPELPLIWNTFQPTGFLLGPIIIALIAMVVLAFRK
jgi:hypothetical protein